MRNDKRSVLLSIALLLAGAVTVSAQVQIELEPNKKTDDNKSNNSRWQIPAATLPCTPDNKAWWDELRDAAEVVRRSRGDKKDRRKFADLLAEGTAKSFKPPIEDRKPIYFVTAQPQYTEEARRRRINGYIVMRVELRADGTVGEVTTRNSLGYGLDESAIAAARKAVFLPAVQNGVFVTFWAQVEMSFRVY